MRAPSDPIARKAVPEFQAPDGWGALYELLGSVFGLADAPRRWFEEIRRRLLGAGWQQHSLDAACFMLFKDGASEADLLDDDGNMILDEDGKFVQVLAVAVFHVDDLISTFAEWCPEGKAALEQFKALFEWGEWNIDLFVFKGVRYVMDAAAGQCQLDMEEYSRNLAWPSLRNETPGRLNKRLQAEFRSCSGSGLA